MRTGKFEESLQSIDKTFNLLEKTKEQFAGDLEIVRSKFYTLKSNVCFILKKYQECDDAATEGLVTIDRIKSSEVSIMRAMNNTKRDLTNNQIRSRAKLQNKKASLIRECIYGKSQMSPLEKMQL